MVGEYNCADSSFFLNHRQKNPKSGTNLHRAPYFSSTWQFFQLDIEDSKIPFRHHTPSFLNSCRQGFKADVVSCAVLLVSAIALQVVVTTAATSSPTSSTTSPLQLNIGILVAESCDEIFSTRIRQYADVAISDFKKFVELKESLQNPSRIQVNCETYCFNDTRSVISNLDNIFGNSTIHAVIGVSTYDVHSSFIPLAEIYGKAYIPVNTFILTLVKTQSVSFAPKFSQRGLMLAQVLDMYRWQNVYIIFANFNFWQNFAVYMYFEMTIYEFKVNIGFAIDSPVTSDDALKALKNVGKSKVILLLMDVEDQLTVLAAASSLSMNQQYAYFSFSKTPYDVTLQSIIGIQPSVLLEPRFFDIKFHNVNIFESLFVIGISFPKQSTKDFLTNDTNRRERDVNIDNSLVLREKRSIHLIKKVGDSSLFLNSKNDNSFDRRDSNTQPAIKVTKAQQTHKTRYKVSTKSVTSDVSCNSVNMLPDEGSQKSEEYSRSTPVPMSSSYGNSFLARARLMNPHNDDLIHRRTHPISPGELKDAKRVENFGLFETVTKLTRWVHSRDHSPKNAKSEALVFESEKIKLLPKSGANSRSVLQESLSTVSKFRSKRDVELYVASEADFKAVYDTIFLLAYAVHLQAKRSNIVPFSDDLIASIANLVFPGKSGEYKVDSEQEVSFDFALYDFNVSSGAMLPKIFYEATSSETWVLKKRLQVSWPGGTMIAADECFKQAPDCNEGLKTSIIAAIVICALGVIVIIIVVAFFIRRHWVTKEMTKGPNKVILYCEDLVFVLRKDITKGSRIMKSRVTLLEKDNAPDLIRGSDPSRSMASINELSDFTETARYNGDLVHVKELNITGFEMRSKLLTFIRMCRDLRHENLNPYVGFLADPSRPSIVMEYCNRGSLHDIIHNDDFKLDWDFKLSLLTDLVRGVRYLHSSALKFHGHMTSKCCVIDSRFVLKITDYGVSGIMERCKATKIFEAKDLLWSAPELLRDEFLLQRGSDKGDIYAMSIIFQEVALRTEPYSTTGLTPEEIVKKLKKPPPLIRPSVTPQAAPPLFIQIMKQCWSEMPEMRPSMDEVYDQFKKLTGGKKANIVDTMFKMLEKYSTDLEDIVAERTMQLEEEKKKTDQLLFRMLPSTVAESLKLGRSVEAECFDEVTIYFSDIVGFTTISAMSTPMQVVDLLNDLYSMFDETINNHDVYKVETIGDAYMVVSGLPIRNGNRHAGEIGTLALVLLSQCGKFTIRHMPHVPLRLRIGLHTGSCVAGVVGLTMPRFCLFGDTVNTASRMESSGAAFRVHISETCKLALDVLGGYKTEYRGQTELKGKGMHNTYWLIGKEGFDKELPEPPPLIGDNTHGLDSILGDLKIDLKTGLNLPKTDVVSKSNSAPNLATPLRSPKVNNSPPSSNDISTISSHPENLHEMHKHTCKKATTNNTNIIAADINIVGGTTNFDVNVSATNQNNGTKMQAGNGACQSRHSESNDSGFGSERKHSESNDGYAIISAADSDEQTNSEHFKRDTQQINSRTCTTTSSSDVSLRKVFLPIVDIGEDLTTVTEV